MSTVIHKNSPYPVRNSTVYCQKEPDGTAVILSLYEGDDNDVRKNFFLGKLEIFDVPPRSKDVCNNIRVDLIIDKSGIARIEARTYDEGNSNQPVNEYTKEIPVKTNNGSLCAGNVQHLKDEILTWFPKDVQYVISKAFNSSVCAQ